jgi:hypothetical protein
LNVHCLLGLRGDGRDENADLNLAGDVAHDDVCSVLLPCGGDE